MKPLIVLSVSLLAMACGPKKAGLRGDLDRIEAVLKAKDCAALYETLSSGNKTLVSKDDFTGICKKNGEKLGKLHAALKGGKGKEGKLAVDYRAVVTLKDGSQVVLVQEKGQWKVDTDLLGFYPRSTPGEALASFIKAFEAKRWDVLAALMPSQYQAQDDAKLLEKEWGGGEGKAATQEIVTVLKDHLKDEITVTGDQAVLNFAPQHRVELLKEKGAWVVLHVY